MTPDKQSKIKRIVLVAAIVLLIIAFVAPLVTGY